MSNVFRPRVREEISDRIDRLQPDSTRQWGRMTPHQAVCHLNDSFKAALGDRPLPSSRPDLNRRLQRLFAFTLPMPWPKGVPTSKQVDAEREGTPPGDFEEDVGELKELLDRFAATDGHLEAHYHWGDMSRGEWGRYGYRHIDHHLRQFGV